MKDRSGYALQFSGYPLNIAKEKTGKTAPVLKMISKQKEKSETSLQNNPITNDPKNWDINWFASYE